MTEEGEERRAAAICEQCGSCHVVRVGTDGSVRVIGTNGTCECGSEEYHVLGSDGPETGEAVEPDAAPVESRGT